MSMVKRMFGQQSARVASSSNSNGRHTMRTSTEIDPDEEDRLAISARDDTALILRSNKSNRKAPPLHSNSLACLFNEKSSSIIGMTRGFSIHRSSNSNNKEIKRSFSTNCRFRSATAPPGGLTNINQWKISRTCSRTCTLDDLARLERSIGGFRLSTHQRGLIGYCWREINKRGDSVGTYVLRWIFKREPKLKLIFGLIDLSHDQLLKNNQFRKHAQTLSDVLEMVVDSVRAERDSDSLLDDVMGPFLCSYGSDYARMEMNRNENMGWEKTDWELLAAGMKEFAGESWRISGSWTTLGNFQKRNEALHAWQVLVHFIVAKMKRGYDLEKEKNMGISKKISEYGQRRTVD